jgi:nicotinamidase-related amidase
MLKKNSTILVIVDVQGKLAHLMHEKQALFEGLRRLVKGIKILGIPILWAEQKPESLGPTIPEVADLLPDMQPISKSSFSCCRNDRFLRALKNQNRNQILLVGIETHICVYQTAVDLLNLGYEVQVVTDGVSSRTSENKQVGLQKMRDAGASLTSTETALFELLEVAEGPQFKEILKIVK